MTDKELKKLTREELLEILIEQASEVESLKAELEQMKERLASRELKFSKVGSIAEAALSVNEVFEKAQAAADQYLENIRDTEALCEKMRRDTEKKAARMLAAAEKLAAKTEAEAKEKSEKYWSDLSAKLEHFYDEHPGMREAISKQKNL